MSTEDYNVLTLLLLIREMGIEVLRAESILTFRQVFVYLRLQRVKHNNVTINMFIWSLDHLILKPLYGVVKEVACFSDVIFRLVQVWLAYQKPHRDVGMDMAITNNISALIQ